MGVASSRRAADQQLTDRDGSSNSASSNAPPTSPDGITDRPAVSEHAESPIRQAFISHTGKDASSRLFVATVLKPALGAAGLPVFIDYSNVAAGADRPAAALADAAANSAVVVVVLSSSYVRSLWCMYELDLALHRQLDHSRPFAPRVVPVLLDRPSDILQGLELQQLWGDRLAQNMVATDHCVLVDPQRWSHNLAMLQQLQGAYLHSMAGKDAEYQLARQAVAQVAAALPAADSAQLLAGYKEQEAELLAALSVPEQLGLWLHGVGRFTSYSWCCCRPSLPALCDRLWMTAVCYFICVLQKKRWLVEVA
jgi:hypothetical protein